MSWLQKLVPGSARRERRAAPRGKVPEGVWEKCAGCGAALYRPNWSAI